jgi:Secretion system C-terminal sorting domain
VKTIDDPITINIYPNPASDQLFIQHDLNLNKSTSSVLLMDVMGRVVLQKPLDASLIQLDVSTISPGIYFVQILSKEGRVSVCKKIIKVY